MSGTSADGVDAALVRIGTTAAELEMVGFCSIPFEDELRKRIHELIGGAAELRELVRLDLELGRRFAEAALQVLREAGVTPSEVEGIGSHGQTVGHFPEADLRGTLQLGAAAVIHERTRIPVISDFRSADMAAGGEGAPLTPLFHHLYFAVPGELRAVLNIGGFTNVTYLPGAEASGIVAFDPGPGNALLDRAARWASGGAERFDRDGARAGRGRTDAAALAELLSAPYFALPPPKSTGHERFGAAFFERARDAVLARGGSADDVLATLSELTIESVADSATRFFAEPPERWIVYGGGARNPVLLASLRGRLAPAPVETSDAHGIPVDALEAVAFAAFGWLSSRGLPGNLPQATGARRAVPLGSATPPAGFRSPS
jgi:anhydro-N-acetylmuramic acid kinase